MKNIDHALTKLLSEIKEDYNSENPVFEVLKAIQSLQSEIIRLHSEQREVISINTGQSFLILNKVYNFFSDQGLRQGLSSRTDLIQN